MYVSTYILLDFSVLIAHNHIGLATRGVWTSFLRVDKVLPVPSSSGSEGSQNAPDSQEGYGGVETDIVWMKVTIIVIVESLTMLVTMLVTYNACHVYVSSGGSRPGCAH